MWEGAYSNSAPRLGRRNVRRLVLTQQEAIEIITATKGMERREAVKAMRTAGLTLEQIGESLGVSRERARQLLDSPAPFKRKQMEERAAKVSELLGMGMTPPDIRRRLDLQMGTMSLLFKKYLKEEEKVNYLKELKARRDELQVKVDEIKPVMEKLRKVKAAIAVFEPRKEAASSKDAGDEP